MSARRARFTRPALPGAEPRVEASWRAPRSPRRPSQCPARGRGRDLRRPRSWWPQRAGLPLRRSLAHAGRSDLASSACAPGLGPRDPPGPWRVLVAPQKPATEVPRKGSWTFGHCSVPGVSVRNSLFPVYEDIFLSPSPTP